MMAPQALRRSFLGAALALGVAVTPGVTLRAQATARQGLPAKLTDQEFWKLITDLSEPAGTFRSENLLSNETGYQMVIPDLLKAPREGKVYLGVGPEQNFTYITAIKPAIAIIVDIRRGNLLEHLLYKALFELSADRAEFVSKLFSKPRPSGLDSTSSADAIMDAFYYVVGDSATYQKNRRDVFDLLVKKHGFALSESDTSGMFWIWDQFYYTGLDISYSSSTPGGLGGRGGYGRSRRMPSYQDIATATDGAGLNRGFLGSEKNWRLIKQMEAKNLIVPVVGDFGGPKAIKSVGKWLKERNAIVTAFYASNVEQYLFGDDKAFTYYDNVAALPTDSTSVFIRSQGAAWGFGRAGGFGGAGGMRMANRLCPIQDLLNASKAGHVSNYGDIFAYCQ